LEWTTASSSIHGQTKIRDFKRLDVSWTQAGITRPVQSAVGSPGGLCGLQWLPVCFGEPKLCLMVLGVSLGPENVCLLSRIFLIPAVSLSGEKSLSSVIRITCPCLQVDLFHVLSLSLRNSSHQQLVLRRNLVAPWRLKKPRTPYGLVLGTFLLPRTSSAEPEPRRVIDFSTTIHMCLACVFEARRIPEAYPSTSDALLSDDRLNSLDRRLGRLRKLQGSTDWQ
jgi:hypothetical protein